jgi:hypothetical protein
MAGNLRIFVSSTCSDLFQERRHLVEAFLDQGHEVIVSEMGTGFPVSPHLTCIENCLDAITNHADVVVLVISSRYGSLTTAGTSVTEEEYRRAIGRQLPVYTFVRKSVLSALPIFRRDPTVNFAPLVEDSRILAFVDSIATSNRWLFPFEEAREISDIVKYQISALVKRSIDETRPALTGNIRYVYTNNTNVLLSPTGVCRRSLEYEIINASGASIDRINGSDRSDLDTSTQDLDLLVHDVEGRRLDVQMTVEQPRFKRWDIVFPRPLLPGESIRYFASWISVDSNQMETGHTRGGVRGFIQALFPQGTIRKLLSVSVRTPAGWEDSPPQVVVSSNPVITAVSYHYRFDSPYSSFRVAWE